MLKIKVKASGRHAEQLAQGGLPIGSSRSNPTPTYQPKSNFSPAAKKVKKMHAPGKRGKW